MNPQFKKGVLEMCVIAAMYEHDCYGYELVNRISESIQISEGTIYPLLKRLSDDGYVSTYLKESQEGPPRKYYNLNQKGKDRGYELFNEWSLFIKNVDKLIGNLAETNNKEEDKES